MKKLAIVIPAYKPTYFDQTLRSIAAQTSQDFSLYIGDDKSPYDLSTIVERYAGIIDIHYTRFDQNLGGHDLVAQWERCIDLTQGEPWLWLFSDDDIMEPNCVENALSAIEKGENKDLYRFNVDVIDSNNNTIRKVTYPPHIDCEDFYKNRIAGNYNCFVVEYVFNRDSFFEKGRFQNFDLAWGSDTITWLKLSKEKGITTLPQGHVKWRASGENITTIESAEIIERKLNSTVSVYSYYSHFWSGKYRFMNMMGLLKALYGYHNSISWMTLLKHFLKYIFK